MTYDLQVRQRQDNLPEPVDALAPGLDGQGEAREGVVIKLHRLLRGRYIWALLLAAILGGAGAYLGYTSRQPKWSATGMIHIRPYIAPVVRDSELTGTLPGYNSYREAQVTLLRQQRVIDNALQSPEWRALNRGGTTDEVWQDFLANLQVSAPSGNEVVMVSFSDVDPAACSAAVKGVLRAYSAIYLENAERQQEEKLRTLESIRVALSSERDAKREAIRSIAREFGTDDLRPIHQTRQTSLNTIESELRLIESKLAGLNAYATTQAATRPTTGPDGESPPAGTARSPGKSPRDMTIGEIALVDAKMRQMYDDLLDAEVNMSISLQGKGPNHPEVRQANAKHEAKKQAMERYAQHWRDAAENALANSPDKPGGIKLTDPVADSNVKVRSQLEASRKQYLELIQTLQKEAKDIGLKMLDIDRLRQEEKDKDSSLADVVRRIETLRTESKAAGRVEIVSWGDRPTRLKDTRIQFALMFGMTGFGAGIGVFVLIGLVDRRMRNLDDARLAARLPLLGILPELPQDLSDPDQASLAAHCVHQIRTLLQIGRRGEDRWSYAVTSPAAGTGKTSLTLALGVSFAAASSRVLMVDCDIIGGGLTARIETIIRRKIGQILRRDGSITEPQLDTALRLAQNSQRKLGEILVELGYLSSEDVARALAVQQDQVPIGMMNALAGEAIEDCVAETGIQNLFILPVGGAAPSDASKLSPQSLRGLLERAKEHFDVILIDTGPVPGSIEASAAATAADGVIMVVARGEKRPVVEKALRYLQELGARLSGMVFNRAGNWDVDAATTTTRLTSLDRTGRAAVVMPAEPVDARFGPVAGAVATSTPANKGGTRPQQP